METVAKNDICPNTLAIVGLNRRKPKLKNTTHLRLTNSDTDIYIPAIYPDLSGGAWDGRVRLAG